VRPSGPTIVLTAATAAQAAVSLIAFGLPSIGPELQQEFGLSLFMLGAVLTANLLGSGLFLIVGGIAVDRYGSRLITLVGTAVGVAALVGAAFSPTSGLLLLALFVSGVGASVVPIAGIGALFRAFPATRRAWALGVRQMAVPLGGIIGAVTLPPLADAGGARAVMLFAAGALGVFGITFGLAAADVPIGSARPPIAVWQILRIPDMGRLLVCAGLFIVVLQSVLVYAVPAAEDAGLSRFAAGAMFFALQVGAGLSRIVWGRVADRQNGARRVRTLVEVALVGAIGGVLFLIGLHAGAAAAIPAAFVLAFGAFGWNALVYVRAGEMAPTELAAQAVSIAATVVFLLSAVATPPLGALADTIGWDGFWALTAGLAACAALVAAGLRRDLARPRS
jgi:MFS family permease